jgi:hypothetical protein
LRNLGDAPDLDAAASYHLPIEDALDFIALNPALRPLGSMPEDHVMRHLSFAHGEKDIGGMSVSARTPPIEFESDVKDRRLILYVHQGKAVNASHSRLTVLQADGRPLPVWVSTMSDGCIVADIPEGTEHLDLKIIFHSGQQPDTETVIRAYLPSGEIVVKSRETPGKPEALDFNDQLKRSRKERVIPDFW